MCMLYDMVVYITNSCQVLFMLIIILEHHFYSKELDKQNIKFTVSLAKIILKQIVNDAYQYV